MRGIDEKSDRTFILFYLKAGCLLFWGCWFFMVFITNLTDLMTVMGNLSSNFHFRSGNYDLLKFVLNIYHTPNWILVLLFLCDITATAVITVLFLAAFKRFMSGLPAWKLINTAFAVSMAFWAVFILMEEVFIAYSYEVGHFEHFMIELLTLLFIHLLPHHESQH